MKGFVAGLALAAVSTVGLLPFPSDDLLVSANPHGACALVWPPYPLYHWPPRRRCLLPTAPGSDL